jgi:hypothetical protein
LRRWSGLKIGATPMWVLALEAGVALGLLVFIIWWTMGSVRKKDKEREQSRKD